MRNLTELDLPEILERLKEKAKVSAQKRDDGPGPPSYLMNDLEGTYAEMQILIKKRETTASKFFSKNVTHHAFTILFDSDC